MKVKNRITRKNKFKNKSNKQKRITKKKNKMTGMQIANKQIKMIISKNKSKKVKMIGMVMIESHKQMDKRKNNINSKIRQMIGTRNRTNHKKEVEKTSNKKNHNKY